MHSKNRINSIGIPSIKLQPSNEALTDADGPVGPSILLHDASDTNLEPGSSSNAGLPSEDANDGPKKPESFLFMNLDPNLVRRQSRLIDAEVDRLKASPEGRSRLSVALQRERSEMERMLQTYEDTQSQSYLKPRPKTIRQTISGSISVPLNKMSIKLYGSAKAVIEEQERFKNAGGWIVHPYSNFRFTWDIFTLVMLLVNVLLIPVALAFWHDTSQHGGWMVFKVSYILYCIYYSIPISHGFFNASCTRVAVQSAPCFYSYFGNCTGKLK